MVYATQNQLCHCLEHKLLFSTTLWNCATSFMAVLCRSGYSPKSSVKITLFLKRKPVIVDLQNYGKFFKECSDPSKCWLFTQNRQRIFYTRKPMLSFSCVARCRWVCLVNFMNWKIIVLVGQPNRDYRISMAAIVFILQNSVSHEVTEATLSNELQQVSFSIYQMNYSK